MLDYALMGNLRGSIFSDSIYRCRSCGQGPVMLGDGFMMNRCGNCGSYQHATDLVGFDFSWLKSAMSSLWQRIKVWTKPSKVIPLGETENLRCESPLKMEVCNEVTT